MAGNKSDNIWFPRRLFKSEAWRTLTNTSMAVYGDFKCRCRIQGLKHKGRRKEWIISNNGELVYTYDEALKKDITKARFARAITELVEHGLIDITHSGAGGRKGDVSLYAISDRWKYYGTDQFELKTRKKDKRQGRGFAVVHAKRKAEKEKKIINIEEIKMSRLIA